MQCCAERTVPHKMPTVPENDLNSQQNKAQCSTGSESGQTEAAAAATANMHKQNPTQAQPTSRASANEVRQTEYSKAGKSRGRQDRQNRPEFRNVIPPPTSTTNPCGMLAPMHRRFRPGAMGVDTCKGFMGLLGVGVHMHQVG